MLWLIVILVAFGFLLLFLELFVPGLILGTLGVIALLTAVVLTYVGYSFLAGSLLLAAITLVGIVGFLFWLRAFPRSAIGRKVALNEVIPAPVDPAGVDDLAGAEGTAISQLRPSGVAKIAGRRIDVLAAGEFIAAGESVRVDRIEGAVVFVRRVS